MGKRTKTLVLLSALLAAGCGSNEEQWQPYGGSAKGEVGKTRTGEPTVIEQTDLIAEAAWGSVYSINITLTLTHSLGDCVQGEDRYTCGNCAIVFNQQPPTPLDANTVIQINAFELVDNVGPCADNLFLHVQHPLLKEIECGALPEFASEFNRQFVDEELAGNRRYGTVQWGANVGTPASHFLRFARRPKDCRYP